MEQVARRREREQSAYSGFVEIRYWQFTLYLFGGLLICELIMSTMPSLYSTYSDMIGIIGLSVEATLPIPQIIANMQTKSCRGFRLSVLISWLGGDAMKIFWFFTATSEIPWAFKVCGIFQACCDAFLGVQYLMYGEGEQAVKSHSMPLEDQNPPWSEAYKPAMHGHSRSLTPTRRQALFNDTEME